MAHKYYVTIIENDGFEIRILASSLKYAEKKWRELRKLADIEENVPLKCEWLTTPEGYRITTIKELKKGDYFWIANYKKGVGKTPYVKDIYNHAAEKYYVYKFYDVNDSRLLFGSTMVTDEVTF